MAIYKDEETDQNVIDWENQDETKHEQGVCPHCKGSLDYGSSEVVDDMIYYEWECEECGTEGKEWYSLEFLSHNAK